MELTDRIKYIIKINNLTSTSFADEIGVQRSSISHVLSGRNKPSFEFIQKTLFAFPKISADWLISGKTLVNQTTIENTEIKQEPSPTPTIINKEIKKVVIFYTDNTFEEVNNS